MINYYRDINDPNMHTKSRIHSIIREKDPEICDKIKKQAGLESADLGDFGFLKNTKIKMLNYSQFLNESIKYLSPSEIEKWLSDRSNRIFIAVDTETTGLEGPKKEQITQISGVAFK